MNVIQRTIDALRHPAEYDAQRARRRWRNELRKREPIAMAMPVKRVDLLCRCGHTRSVHVVVSAAQAACREACTCVIFRADRVVVE